MVSIYVGIDWEKNKPTGMFCRDRTISFTSAWSKCSSVVVSVDYETNCPPEVKIVRP